MIIFLPKDIWKNKRGSPFGESPYPLKVGYHTGQDFYTSPVSIFEKWINEESSKIIIKESIQEAKEENFLDLQNRTGEYSWQKVVKAIKRWLKIGK